MLPCALPLERESTNQLLHCGHRDLANLGKVSLDRKLLQPIGQCGQLGQTDFSTVSHHELDGGVMPSGEPCRRRCVFRLPPIRSGVRKLRGSLANAHCTPTGSAVNQLRPALPSAYRILDCGHVMTSSVKQSTDRRVDGEANRNCIVLSSNHVSCRAPLRCPSLRRACLLVSGRKDVRDDKGEHKEACLESHHARLLALALAPFTGA